MSKWWDEIETLNDDRMDELFPSKDGELQICVGSWKAYNECNEHSLGTYWRGHPYIDFLELRGSDELYAVLKTLGWSEAETEELFVQDYISDFAVIKNCDYANPANIADVVDENRSDLLDDDFREKLGAMAEMDTRYEDFLTALHEEAKWEYYPNMTAGEYEEQLIADCYPEVWDALNLSGISSYITIDYEALARNDDIYESSHGVLRPY